MSKNYAVMHVGIGNRRFKPGEELPEITDEMWKRLAGMGAIRCEYDPVEAQMALADEDADSKTPDNTDDTGKKLEAAEDTADAAQQEEAAQEAEDAQKMPEINVMDGIDDVQEEMPKKRPRKAGKA